MKLNKIAQLFLAWKRRKITKLMKPKNAYYSVVMMRANGNQLVEIKELVEAGKIKAKIDKVFPLGKAKEALLYIRKSRTKGKVVLSVKAE